MRVTIKINDTDLQKSLSGLKSDLPWVQSSTINDLLKGAQQEQYGVMRQNFTIRNNAFLKYSVRITQFANKRNMSGTLAIADLGTKNTSQIWELFEGGGTKTPRNKYIAVPSTQAWGNRSRKRPERTNPRNLKGSFVVDRGGKKQIFARVGKSKKKDVNGRDPNVKLMYTLSNGVKIPDKLHFYATTVPYIEKNYQSTLDRLLAVSMKKNGWV